MGIIAALRERWLFILIGILIVTVAYVQVQANKHWAAYKATNECKVTGKQRMVNTTLTGYDSNGNVTFYEGLKAQDEWYCSVTGEVLYRDAR